MQKEHGERMSSSAPRNMPSIKELINKSRPMPLTYSYSLLMSKGSLAMSGVLMSDPFSLDAVANVGMVALVKSASLETSIMAMQ